MKQILKCDIRQFIPNVGYKTTSDMMVYNSGSLFHYFEGTEVVEKIIFKKINNFCAKEVLTGVKFDIIFSKGTTSLSPEKIFSNCSEIDTFIYYNDSRSVTSSELEEYINNHADIENFKNRLISIKEKGKENRICKKKEIRNEQQKIKKLCKLALKSR